MSETEDSPRLSPQELEEYVVERWNRLYPVGTTVVVQNPDGSRRQTQTRTAAQVFQNASTDAFVAGIYLEGAEEPVQLSICIPVIPTELQFLLENRSAEQVRKHWEGLREGRDPVGLLYALATHWKLLAQAEPENAEVYLRCAKQLRQRAEWIKEDIAFYREIAEAAPHLLPKR